MVTRPRPTPVLFSTYPDSWEILMAEFPTRATNALVRDGYKTLHQLSVAKWYDLLDVPGFGIRSLAAVADRMAELGEPMDPSVMEVLGRT